MSLHSVRNAQLKKPVIVHGVLVRGVRHSAGGPQGSVAEHVPVPAVVRARTSNDMRALLAGLVLSAAISCHCGGRDGGTAYPDAGPGDLESLPLHRLLAMRKELRKNGK